MLTHLHALHSLVTESLQVLDFDDVCERKNGLGTLGNISAEMTVNANVAAGKTSLASP